MSQAEQDREAIEGAYFVVQALKISGEVQDLLDSLDQSPLDFIVPFVRGEFDHMSPWLAMQAHSAIRFNAPLSAHYAARDGSTVWLISDGYPKFRVRMLLGPEERW